VQVADRAVGVRAGTLLDGAGSGSDRAVDAFLVATGDLAGDALVATVDVDDIGALASLCTRVSAVQIQP